MSRHNNQTISEEILLGFLLSSLPKDEQESIERLASIDPKLRQRIDDLRCLLAPLKELQQEFEARSDLTASTMAMIAAASSQVIPDDLAPDMKPIREFSQSTKMAWIDSLVTLAAGIVVLSILLPSIWLTRETSRRIACASNIREISQALTSFAQSNLERKLPKIEVNGPLSFAGVYAIRLNDAGLIESRSRFWCPSFEGIDREQSIPSMQSYLTATPHAQQNMRYTAGGNYSYNLGNFVAGTYVTPSMISSVRFAVMGDTIVPFDPSEELGPIHGRNAANILYDDGTIQFVRIDKLDSLHFDDPYRNRALQQAVGIGADDCCLGPSFQSPFLPIDR